MRDLIKFKNILLLKFTIKKKQKAARETQNKKNYRSILFFKIMKVFIDYSLSFLLILFLLLFLRAIRLSPYLLYLTYFVKFFLYLAHPIRFSLPRTLQVFYTGFLFLFIHLTHLIIIT